MINNHERTDEVNLHDIEALQNIQVPDGICLRPLEDSDATRIIEIINGDPDIRERVSVAAIMCTEEEVKAQVKAYRQNEHRIRYAIIQGGDVIGLVSFSRDINSVFGTPDEPNDYYFGYFLDSKERGKGIVPAAVNGIMQTAMQHLTVRQFFAYCEDANTASQSVLYGLGFRATQTIVIEPNNDWTERKYTCIPLPTLKQAQAISSEFARYENMPDPEGILRKGLVEEACETCFELSSQQPSNAQPPDPEKIKGEIGDILWYLAEISRFKETPLTAWPSNSTNIQTIANIADITPVWSPYNDKLPIKDNQIIDKDSKESCEYARMALAWTIARVVDVLNPKSPLLWVNGKGEYIERISLAVAMTDVLRTSYYIADTYGFSLGDAFATTIEKLKNRKRPTHVVEQNAKHRLPGPTDSLRGRLDFFIYALVGALEPHMGEEQQSHNT